MQTSSHFSALSSWVLLIARAIDSYGLDSGELFSRAGLDHTRLSDPVARFSSPAVGRLWSLSEEACGDPAFGLTVADFWHPTTLHALGYAWLASNNLDEAFARAVRYTRMVNTAAGGVLRIEKTGGVYRVVIDDAVMQTQAPQASLDAALAMLVVMCRAAHGPGFAPIRVSLRRDETDDTGRFGEYFAAPVKFSQDNNVMWLDPRVVAEPLVTANPELVRVNDKIVTDYLARLDRNDIVMQVRSKLADRLPDGQLDEAEIAAMLNLSRRSLQRRLGEQGTTFSSLYEQTRREMSLQYVRDSRYSFGEIAYLVGFAEPGNFSRAFRRWHGLSPSQYRDQM